MGETISVSSAVLIALSGIVIVFCMLAVLSVLIMLISKAVRALQGTPGGALQAAAQPGTGAAPAPVQGGGNVSLVGVDELTAACIMAIVSEETGIALPELVFKQIKAL